MKKTASNPAPDLLKQRLKEAMRLHVQGQADAAREAYEMLLKDWPNQPDILHALGTISLQAQQWEAAEEYFRKALTANPRQIRYMLPLANALAQQNKTEQTMDVLIDVLKIDPNHIETLNMLFALCLPLTDEEATCPPLDRLMAANPGIPTLHSVAIRLCRERGEHVKRLSHLEALYRKGMRSEIFYQEYGAMLRDNGQYERGVEIAQEALVHYPETPQLHKLRADLYCLLGHYAKSMADWSWVVTHHPEDHHARLAVGIIKLLVSDGKDGYEEYAAHRDRAIVESQLTISIPEWRGENPAGKRLLLWCSQGVGDVVMFAGMIPWLIAQGAHVTLAMIPKLMPLFMRSFPEVRTIPFTHDVFKRYAEECDFQVVLGQLMVHVLPHYIPAEHPPYLKAARIPKIREKYLALSPQPKKLVGISWHTTNTESFSYRNISLSQWRPLFELPHVQYISLQYGNHEKEIEAVNREFPGKIYADPAVDTFDHMDMLAVQMTAMDEIVSIDNSTVHLAGALGVKTTLLLSAAPEWRWGLERTDSRWYKSLYIERQKKLLDWKPVMARVKERLG